MAGVVHGGAWRIVDLVDWKEGEAKVGFSVWSEFGWFWVVSWLACAFRTGP